METTRLMGKSEIFKEPIFDLLKKAEHFVDICTGLNPVFWSDKKVHWTIGDCARKVLKLRILIDKETDIQNLKRNVSWIFKLEKEYPGTLEIAKAIEDTMHCILIDEKYFVIYSHAHKIDEIIVSRKLIVSRPSRLIAIRLIRDFNKWWNNAERVYDA